MKDKVAIKGANMEKEELYLDEVIVCKKDTVEVVKYNSYIGIMFLLRKDFLENKDCFRCREIQLLKKDSEMKQEMCEVMSITEGEFDILLEGARIYCGNGWDNICEMSVRVAEFLNEKIPVRLVKCIQKLLSPDARFIFELSKYKWDLDSDMYRTNLLGLIKKEIEDFLLGSTYKHLFWDAILKKIITS